MISELFNEIMSHYPHARDFEVFKGNSFGSVIRNDIPAALRNSNVLCDTYVVKGSVGQGGWAMVPWIAVLDSRITTTTQNGVYIVYLFAEDGSAVYLTLNQGCTDVIKKYGRRETERILADTAKDIQNGLSFPTELYERSDIYIGNKYYEKGCIAYRRYERGSMPDDSVLLADLAAFCDMYNRYCKLTLGTDDNLQADDSITSKKPFDLHEAVVLLDVYLSVVKRGQSQTKAAHIASRRLRALAVQNGLHIDEGFRSAMGLQNRLRSIGAIFEGVESKSAPGTQMFMEAVRIYNNEPARYADILKSAENSSQVSQQTYSDRQSSEEGRQHTMVDNNPSSNQDFFIWLPNAVPSEVTDEITKSYSLVNTMLIQRKLLPQAIIKTTSISQIEGARQRLNMVFANKANRATASKLLMTYIAYLKSKETPDPTCAPKTDIGAREDWIRMDFSNSTQFERTVPAYCSINGTEYTGKNWTRILVAIAEAEIARGNAAMDVLYTKSVIAKRNDRPFLMKDKIEGLNCSQLTNGYWLNINYSIPRLMDLIQALCLHCGYTKMQIVIIGQPKGSVRAAKNAPDAPKHSENTVDIANAESFLRSTGLRGATIKEMIDEVQPGAAVYPTQKALEDNMNVMVMSGNRYVHIDSFVDLNEAEGILGRIVSTHFLQFGGYSNSQLLYGAASRDLSMFLNDNDCENIDDVYAISRFLFEKKAVAGHAYKFSSPHIFETTPDFPLTLKGLMINLARHNGGVLMAGEAKSYLQKTMLTYGSIGQLLQIGTDNTFLLYDADRYLLSEKLGIDDAWIRSIHERLDNLFRQADVAFVILRDINSTWFDTLPALPMTLRWTMLLLQEVLQKLPAVGFKVVKSELNQAYDTIAAAIVPDNSPVQTFPDVVTLFMQERHNLPMKMSGEDLRIELRDAGMLEGNELIYALPKALDDYRFAWSNENKTVYVRGN